MFLASVGARFRFHALDLDRLMRRSAIALPITPSMIEEGRVLVGEDRYADLIGVAAVEKMDSEGEFDLARLFVQPFRTEGPRRLGEIDMM